MGIFCATSFFQTTAIGRNDESNKPAGDMATALAHGFATKPSPAPWSTKTWHQSLPFPATNGCLSASSK